MRMFCLSAADCALESIWADVAPLLERFERATGEISAEQVRTGAQAEQIQVWGLQDADGVHLVVLTEIATTPKGLVCTIRAAIGEARVGLQARLLGEIGTWARALGCVCVRLVGRKGWLRRFRRFRQTAVVMEWAL